MSLHGKLPARFVKFSDVASALPSPSAEAPAVLEAVDDLLRFVQIRMDLGSDGGSRFANR